MTKRFLPVLVVWLLLWNVSSSYAQWSLRTQVDAITGEVQRIAMVENENGYKFLVYRIRNGEPAWATFRLPDSDADILANDRAPVMRLDEQKPFNLQHFLDMNGYALKAGFELAENGPKWFSWRIWHGKISEGISEQLRDLMTGNSVTFRFYLFNGGYKDTRFTLESASAAISEALKLNGIPFKAERDTEREEHFRAMKRAKSDCRGRTKCATRVLECFVDNHFNLEDFRDCVSALAGTYARNVRCKSPGELATEVFIKSGKPTQLTLQSN